VIQLSPASHHIIYIIAPLTMAQTAGRIMFRINTVSEIEAQLNSVESKQMAHFRAANDQDQLPHADWSCSPACALWDMERKQSGESKTEEAGFRPKSGQSANYADEFLTGAGSKHAHVMRSIASTCWVFERWTPHTRCHRTRPHLNSVEPNHPNRYNKIKPICYNQIKSIVPKPIVYTYQGTMLSPSTLMEIPYHGDRLYAVYRTALFNRSLNALFVAHTNGGR
jgi:hypothetical protein